jgi:hypothetical protein
VRGEDHMCRCHLHPAAAVMASCSDCSSHCSRCGAQFEPMCRWHLSSPPQGLLLARWMPVYTCQAAHVAMLSAPRCLLPCMPASTQCVDTGSRLAPVHGVWGGGVLAPLCGVGRREPLRCVSQVCHLLVRLRQWHVRLIQTYSARWVGRQDTLVHTCRHS